MGYFINAQAKIGEHIDFKAQFAFSDESRRDDFYHTLHNFSPDMLTMFDIFRDPAELALSLDTSKNWLLITKSNEDEFKTTQSKS